MIDTLRAMIGKRVERLILVVYPPFAEDGFDQIDVSAGFIFRSEPEKMYVVSTDQDYLERPRIYHRPVPANCFDWNVFYSRMEAWMKGDEDWPIDDEYYEATQASEFKQIVDNEISDVRLAFAGEDENPFGVKIVFDRDVLLSTPIIDGNTFETLLFNKNNNIEVFRSSGKIEFRSVAELQS